jgi:hypothetical protein
LEFRSSPLQREVDRVLVKGVSQAYYAYRATIHIDKYHFEILKVLSLDIERDYYNSNHDYVNLYAMIPAGMYVKRIYPNRDKLKIEIRKVPLGERIDSQDQTRGIETEMFRAIMDESGNPRVEQNDSNTVDETALNLTNLFTVRFQLLDLTVEQLRLLQVAGSYRNENQENVIKNILNETATKLSADSDIKAYGVDMIPMKDTKKRSHVLIPPINAMDLPSFVQSKMGVYSTGLAQYFQDKFWYIFPKYDYTRFQSSDMTLTVINVPAKQMPNIERTYYLEGSDLTVLATADVKFNDRTVINKIQSGNGTRLTKASLVMEGFVDVKDNKAVSKRKRANNEYYTKDNYNKENYAPISSNNISDNLFKATSKLAGKDGYYLSFVWQNSIPKYILPGMMTKILYLDEGKVREAEGCIVKVHHAIHSEETGITSNRYLCHSGISVFINTNTVDPERLYSE